MGAIKYNLFSMNCVVRVSAACPLSSFLFVFLISCNSFSVSLIHLLYCLTCGDFLDKLPFHKTQPLGTRLFEGLVDIKGAGPLISI